jgi:hypothetical protein
MAESDLEVDYLIVGAGACGMAFADSLVHESTATVAIVDRQHQPGGHWNMAYPFVRLHQPSAFYGVNSRPLGANRIDVAGMNKGFYELASGSEVASYFDQVMRHQFLPTGRVHYFPMSEHTQDGTVTSLLSGKRRRIKARKLVDATYSDTTVPAMRPPPFAVADGIACVPPNELAAKARHFSRYTVIGGGKTGMDACVWLLENGAEPGAIRWIVPRDYWWINRATYQPGDEFLERVVQSVANNVQALAQAESVDDLFARLEAMDEVKRIDPAFKPQGFHGPFVSDGELEQLRRIADVVRLGRVARIEPAQIVLERGAVPTGREVLHVDCTAAGIPVKPSKPIFEGNRITPQWVRLAQPTCSWAMVGHVEAKYQDDEEKNRICRPIPPPDTPRDWVVMMSIQLANQYTWSKLPELRDWQFNSRLDPFTRRMRSIKPDQAALVAHMQRYASHVAGAARNAAKLLAD